MCFQKEEAFELDLEAWVGLRHEFYPVEIQNYHLWHLHGYALDELLHMNDRISSHRRPYCDVISQTKKVAPREWT